MRPLPQSKGPTLKAFQTMAFNLREKLGISAFVRFDAKAYRYPDDIKVEFAYEIFISRENQNLIVRKSWKDIKQAYNDLMEGKDVS